MSWFEWFFPPDPSGVAIARDMMRERDRWGAGQIAYSEQCAAKVRIGKAYYDEYGRYRELIAWPPTGAR